MVMNHLYSSRAVPARKSRWGSPEDRKTTLTYTYSLILPQNSHYACRGHLVVGRKSSHYKWTILFKYARRQSGIPFLCSASWCPFPEKLHDKVCLRGGHLSPCLFPHEVVKETLIVVCAIECRVTICLPGWACVTFGWREKLNLYTVTWGSRQMRRERERSRSRSRSRKLKYSRIVALGPIGSI